MDAKKSIEALQFFATGLTKALGADRKEVDKAFAELKKEGTIVSPVRCKWEPAK
ncbi:MAG TPA: transcriptional regulator [Porphyromonadaceae bacterium]|nr:transcriptional regulator [Porphyromonadaceae bacterium]